MAGTLEQEAVKKEEKEEEELPIPSNDNKQKNEAASSPLSSELSDLEEGAGTVNSLKSKQEQTTTGEDSEAETERLDDQVLASPTSGKNGVSSPKSNNPEDTVSRKRKFDHVDGDDDGLENNNNNNNKQARNDDKKEILEKQNGSHAPPVSSEKINEMMDTEPRDEEDEGHDEEEGEDDEEAEDEDEGEEDEEEVDEEGNKRAREAKNKEAEEAAKMRKEALASLTDIEVEFAKLRDKLHEDKLARFKVEANMCNGGTHPEIVRIYHQIRGMCGEKIGIIEANRKYQRQCILNQTRAIRDRIHQQFFKERGETRSKLMTKIGDKLYKLTRERRQIDNIVPDFAYRVPNSHHIQINNANAHNYEVSLLSAISKYIGFPAAPQIQPASRDEVRNDLQAMGLE